jgi:2-methylcitrate dehydratase PrpD
MKRFHNNHLFIFFTVLDEREPTGMAQEKDSEILNAAKRGKFARRYLLKAVTVGTGSFVFSRIGPGSPTPLSAAAAESKAKTVGPVMKALSAYMSEAHRKPLPDEVTEKTKRHVLDTFAAMISGSVLPPGRAALNFAIEYGGREVATVVASQLLTGPIEAALTNAMLAHADETDDSHPGSQSHPGCAVIPAVLAAGERFGISGEHFLRAVTLGYDVGTRFTIIVGERYESETHRSTHSIAPLFGAAAAAGCATRLDARGMRLLIGYTAQQCSGLTAWRRDSEHVQKAFAFGGMSARSGVTSALLVHGGWTGVEDILSGTDNFFQAFEPAADPAGLFEKLGERFEIMRTNIKKWSVGSPIQAVLDGIEALRAEHSFSAELVQEVKIRLATDEANIVNNREIPGISLQHMVAVMLLDGTVTFRSAHDVPRMKDPEILRQHAKVQLIKDEALQNLMPLRVAIVDIQLVDGTRLTRRVDNVRGTPENPMTRQEIVTKATDLIAPVFGAAEAGKLVEHVMNLEKVKDIRELRPLLQHA